MQYFKARHRRHHLLGAGREEDLGENIDAALETRNVTVAKPVRGYVAAHPSARGIFDHEAKTRDAIVGFGPLDQARSDRRGHGHRGLQRRGCALEQDALFSKIFDAVALWNRVPSGDALVEFGEQAGRWMDREIAAELARGAAELLAREQGRRDQRAAGDDHCARRNRDATTGGGSRDDAARPSTFEDDSIHRGAGK